MRMSAIVGCWSLVVLGAVLFGVDAREAFWQAQGWVFWSAVLVELVLWRWGLGCMVAGVLGWVLLTLGDAVLVATLRLERRREAE